jgi:hypothetical protein
VFLPKKKSRNQDFGEIVITDSSEKSSDTNAYDLLVERVNIQKKQQLIEEKPWLIKSNFKNFGRGEFSLYLTPL